MSDLAKKLERVAVGLTELADNLEEAGLGDLAAKADEYAETVRGLSAIPETVEDKTTAVHPVG